MMGEQKPKSRMPRKGALTTGRPPTVKNTGVPDKAANPKNPDTKVKRQRTYVA